MSIPNRFDIEAEQELESAAIFYEQRRDGLGKAFLNTVGRMRDAFVLHPIFRRNLEYAG